MTFKHTLGAVIRTRMVMVIMVNLQVKKCSSLVTFGGHRLDVDNRILSKPVSEKTENTMYS